MALRIGLRASVRAARIPARFTSSAAATSTAQPADAAPVAPLPERVATAMASPGAPTWLIPQLNPLVDSLFKLREPLKVEPGSWTPLSKRTGLIARKIGMLSVFDHWGQMLPVTVLKVDKCQVVQVKEEENKRGFVSVQVGAGRKKLRRTTKPLMVHFNKAGVEPKAKVVEFKVTKDAVLPPGWTLRAQHFLPGQYVDVTGITIGKGFQGPMKRWGFGGQPASHGTSLAHRSHGATGGKQDPGRVWPGKKMAGHMGNKQKTVRSLEVYKIEPKRDLIYVLGAVPGNAGGWVYVRDAYARKFPEGQTVPFPTHVPKEGETEPEELVKDPGTEDPFAYGLQERE